MPTWTTTIWRMQLQRRLYASSCNLDTTPTQLPWDMPKKLRYQEGVETAVRWQRVDTRAALQRCGSAVQPQVRYQPAPGWAPGRAQEAATRGSPVPGRAAPREMEGQEPVEATRVGSPPQLSLVSHTLCVASVCLGRVPGRRRLEQSHLTCSLRARGLRASLAQSWPVPIAARADLPARLPLPPSPALPEVAMDAQAASGSGVTAEAPG